MRLTNFLFCCLLIFRLPLLAANSGMKADPKERAQQLASLLSEEWEHELRSDPEMATALGDNRYNDRLGDNSPQFFQSEVEQDRKFLARFEAFDPAGLSAQDALSRELMIRKLREQIEDAEFKPWEMPANQMDGPHLSLIELVTLTPFKDAGDYANYLSRLRQVPRFFDEVIGNMRQGMGDGLMPPRYLLEKVTAEAQEIADKTGEASPFAKPLEKFPAGVAAGEQSRIRSAVLATIESDVVPAYQKFTTFVGQEYAPRGRVGTRRLGPPGWSQAIPLCGSSDDDYRSFARSNS
jgi:uncharacterized protein (DUF885 family)